jgi:hypothetical protein
MMLYDRSSCRMMLYDRSSCRMMLYDGISCGIMLYDGMSRYGTDTQSKNVGCSSDCLEDIF